MVDQMDDRQPELVGQLHEALGLLARLRVPRSAEIGGIARQHRDRPAVEPREGGDDRPPPAPAHLEDAAPVEHRLGDAPHRIDLFRRARHRRQQGLLAPARRIVARGPRRALVRSEEHTSELQSLMRTSYAVFCLKKKNNLKYTSTSQYTACTYVQ